MSVPSPQTCELRDLVADFHRTVARVCPAQVALAERTLERVPPSRWQLEWFLPYWLGEAFGLAQTTARTLVLSNLLGLVAIRLKDDLADGDVPATELPRVTALADALQTAALDLYLPYFPQPAPFWRHTARYLSEWRAATTRVNQLALTDFSVMWQDDTDAACCAAQLGAPLKISARAVWELTQGERAFDTLDRLLDSASSAAVLHDHAVDWDADLGAGRWNFIVAAVSPLPQTHVFARQNRARVVRAWMETGNVLLDSSASANAPRAYFDLIESHIARARECSAALGVRGLQDYLDEFHAIVCGTRDAMTHFFNAQLIQATDSLFGKRPTAGQARVVSHLTGQT